MALSNIQSGEVEFQDTSGKEAGGDLKNVLVPQESNFTVDSNLLALGMDKRVIMNILTNSMFKNKYISFQELPANGRDALWRRFTLGDILFSPKIIITLNVKTGKISFKDNGCGMSREKIENVYRIFGNSDKRNIAEETGQFGIGAKTPFAIVDVFTVITVSMETHRRIELRVTKQFISVVSDEPSNEEPGTEVSFTLPSIKNFGTMKDIFIHNVSKWKCPVYIGGIDEYNELVKNDLISHGLKEGEWDIMGGVYNFHPLTYPVIVENKDYTVAMRSGTDTSIIYIGHIPYEFNFKFKATLEIVLHNPNLVTLIATREGLEQDMKYEEFMVEIHKTINDALMPEFDKYFKNLNIKSNIVNKIHVDDFFFNLFNHMSEMNVIKKSDYPIFAVLKRQYRCFGSHANGKHTKRFVDILNEYRLICWTQKRITNEKKALLLEKLHKDNPTIPQESIALIYLQGYCIKDCKTCKQFKIAETEGNANDECQLGKYKDDPIAAHIDMVPELSRGSLTRRAYSRTRGIRAYSLYHEKNQTIQTGSEYDKKHAIICKDKWDIPYLGDNRSVYVVKDKWYGVLKGLGWTCCDTIEDYKNKIVDETFITGIDGVQISARHLRDYDYIFYGIRKEYLLLIELFYKDVKKFITTESIPDDVLRYCEKPKDQKVMTDRGIEDAMCFKGGKLKIEVNIPTTHICSVIKELSHLNDMKVQLI